MTLAGGGAGGDASAECPRLAPESEKRECDPWRAVGWAVPLGACTRQAVGFSSSAPLLEGGVVDSAAGTKAGRCACSGPSRCSRAAHNQQGSTEIGRSASKQPQTRQPAHDGSPSARAAALGREEAPMGQPPGAATLEQRGAVVVWSVVCGGDWILGPIGKSFERRLNLSGS